LKFSFETESHTVNEIFFHENYQANPFKHNNGSMSVDFPGRGCDTKTVRIGLAYVLAYNPEGYNPQIYGHIIPQKIYFKART